MSVVLQVVFWTVYGVVLCVERNSRFGVGGQEMEVGGERKQSRKLVWFMNSRGKERNLMPENCGQEYCRFAESASCPFLERLSVLTTRRGSCEEEYNASFKAGLTVKQEIE